MRGTVQLATNGYVANFASAGVGTNLGVTVSGLSLNGSSATNYTLSQPTGLTANITAAGVTIVSGITANNKAYDGTTVASLSTNSVVLGGVVAGDGGTVQLATNGYVANFASAGVGTNLGVTVSGLSLSGPSATNYMLSQPTGLTANITAAGVTIVSGVTANNKAYDGTTVASLSTNSVVLGGVVAGDGGTVQLATNGYVANFASAGVGTNLGVTVSGLSLNGSSATNYMLSQPTGLTANITAAGVTIVSGIVANNKAYDGTTVASLSTNSVVLGGVVAGDGGTVQLATNGYVANFASAGVGTNLGVTVSGLSLNGSSATNYTLSQPTGLTANITAAGVTIVSGIVANSKVYDGTTVASLSTNSVVLGGVVAGDGGTVQLATNGYVANFASAGVVTNLGVTVSGLTLNGSSATNYTLSQPTGLTANITAAGVMIVSGIVANNKVYDGTTVASLSTNSVVLGGVVAGDAGTVQLATNGYVANFASAGVGTNLGVTVSGLSLNGSSATNYTLSQPTGLTANITAAGVTIVSGIVANSKVYDGTTVASLSTNSVVLGGVVAGDAGKVQLATNGYVANFASAGVGTNLGVTVSGLSLNGSSATNYTLSQPTGLTANITAAGVTIVSGVTANNKAYDGTTVASLSTNSVVLGGVVAGDGGTVQLATNGYVANFASAGVGTNLGVTVSGLSLSGPSATNYVLSQPTGLTANITAAGVTIVSGVTANNKAYDGTTVASLSTNSVVLGGVVIGDGGTVQLATNGYVANFASAGVGTNLGVTVSGLSLNGSSATNYVLSQPTGLTANITAAGVTIVSGIVANNKAYDGTTVASLSTNSVVLGGVVAGDGGTVQLATNGYVANFASAGVGTNLGVTVSGLSLNGSSATNYTLSQPTGLTANITAAGVTIVSGIVANSKVYDGTTVASLSTNSVVLGGVVAGDGGTVQLATNGYVANFASAGVGTNLGVTVSGLSLSGPSATNYTLSQPTGLTANITAKVLTILSVPSPQLTSIHLTNGTATIAWNSVVGGIYRVQYVNNLAGLGWSDLSPDLTATGSTAAQTNVVTDVPQRFYRVKVLNPGITANNKVYDGTTVATINSNNVILVGVVGGDVVALSTNGYTANFASPNIGTGITVTVNGLSLSGPSATNYTLSQPTGLTANITAAGVTIVSGVIANNKVYDRTTVASLSANSVVLGGMVAGDAGKVQLATNGYVANFASAGVGTNLGVTVSGLILNGSRATNYVLSQPTGLTANITAAGVTIVSGIVANNKAYDGTTVASLSTNSVVLGGVVAGDAGTVQLATNGYVANFASAGVGTNLGVMVSGLTLNGSSATNYVLSQPTSLTANITAAGVTIVSGIVANNKVYDGTTVASLSTNSVVLGGVVAGDAGKVQLATNEYVANFASAGVGTNLAVTVSGLILNGSSATNYVLSQPTGLTANITAAGVTIVSGVTANNKAYDGTTVASLSTNSVVLGGVVAGDAGKVQLATNEYVANFASAGVGINLGVTVSGLTLNGPSAANYVLSQPTGLTANITAAGVTDRFGGYRQQQGI